MRLAHHSGAPEVVTVGERRFMVAGAIALAVGAAFVVAWRQLTATPASDPRALLPLADAPPPRREPRRLPGPPDAPLGEPRAE